MPLANRIRRWICKAEWQEVVFEGQMMDLPNAAMLAFPLDPINFVIGKWQGHKLLSCTLGLVLDPLPASVSSSALRYRGFGTVLVAKFRRFGVCYNLYYSVRSVICSCYFIGKSSWPLALTKAALLRKHTAATRQIFTSSGDLEFSTPRPEIYYVWLMILCYVSYKDVILENQFEISTLWIEHKFNLWA